MRTGRYPWRGAAQPDYVNGRASSTVELDLRTHSSFAREQERLERAALVADLFLADPVGEGGAAENGWRCGADS